MTAHREVVDVGIRRLTLGTGTGTGTGTGIGTGLLVTRGESWEVGEPAVASPAWFDEAERWAAEQGVLDLRATSAAPGFVPLTGAAAGTEHVRPVTLPLPDLAATRAFGARLAVRLRAGDLLVLSGPLGAGKTSLTQGIAAGLGVRGRVTSPTFVLARVHPGRLPLVHVDAYRLQDGGSTGPRSAPLDLDDLDLDAALEDSVTVVEWGEGLVESLTDARLSVLLDRPVGSGAGAADGRTVRVRPHGGRWSAMPAHRVAMPAHRVTEATRGTPLLDS